jgi:DNA-binding PadR family transcriptional regulator
LELTIRESLHRLTPLGVMVLALLSEGDMHPYEMIRLMRFRRDDRLVAITNGTVYHTVARLEQQGMLAEVRVDREGNRPERTTYALTDAGARAVREWVRRELSHIDRPAEFRIALAEAHNLERPAVIALLTERREALAASLAEHADGRHGALARGVPTQYLLELERQETMLAADLDWLDALILRLEREELPWGNDGPPTERYLAQRKAARQ